MNKDIAMVVETDYCVGCYACQSACQDYYGLSVDETYLRCQLIKPEYVDGKPLSYMAPVPYALNRCQECLDAEGAGPCTKICIGRCLHVGSLDEMLDFATKAESRTTVFC